MAHLCWSSPGHGPTEKLQPLFLHFQWRKVKVQEHGAGPSLFQDMDQGGLPSRFPCPAAWLSLHYTWEQCQYGQARSQVPGTGCMSFPAPLEMVHWVCTSWGLVASSMQPFPMQGELVIPTQHFSRSLSSRDLVKKLKPILKGYNGERHRSHGRV